MEREPRYSSDPGPRAVGRVTGRVRLGPVIGRVPPIERAHTEIAHFHELPKPVFSDTSGVRRRRLRAGALTVGALLLILLLAFWISQLSGALE
ncbi:hypothetical protein [Actinoplanes solisilvae]|uniref:hypothetical protein n=1 Tax=Actinoplanes solisilvae TaxID=2486853 RepID=UPI000FDA2FB9|nr:hypothetical protein [Actinoplanes solisilvae]